MLAILEVFPTIIPIERPPYGNARCPSVRTARESNGGRERQGRRRVLRPLKTSTQEYFQVDPTTDGAVYPIRPEE